MLHRPLLVTLKKKKEGWGHAFFDRIPPAGMDMEAIIQLKTIPVSLFD
jgi:hypothetical protein